jgi:hypothetical protein
MQTHIERRTIQIPQGAPIGPDRRPIYGYAERAAYCAGGLAVHKTGNGARWRWMVTHEASGLALEALGAMTHKAAMTNMHAALALDFDWTRGRVETLDALKNRRDVVDAIKAIGNHN